MTRLGKYPCNRIAPVILIYALWAFVPSNLGQAAQTITSPAVAPTSIPVNTATTVTVTAQISDPSLIASSVNLQELDPTGKVFNVISSMYDDGTHGDAVAGDGIYTVSLSFKQSAPFPVVLRVSAAFKGKLTRVFSNTFNLSVTGEAPANPHPASPT